MSEDIKSETPQMRARRLMDEIDLSGRGSLSKSEAKVMLNSIAQMSPQRDGIAPVGSMAEDQPTCRSPIQCEKIRRGDVFIAHTIGGKTRPWVVLHVRDGAVVAVAMTGSKESAPNLFPSACRFWPDNWIGGAVATFYKDIATREVTRPYTARAHLAEVEAAITKSLATGRRKARVVKFTTVTNG